MPEENTDHRPYQLRSVKGDRPNPNSMDPIPVHQAISHSPPHTQPLPSLINNTHCDCSFINLRSPQLGVRIPAADSNPTPARLNPFTLKPSQQVIRYATVPEPSPPKRFHSGALAFAGIAASPTNRLPGCVPDPLSSLSPIPRLAFSPSLLSNKSSKSSKTGKPAKSSLSNSSIPSSPLFFHPQSSPVVAPQTLTLTVPRGRIRSSATLIPIAPASSEEPNKAPLFTVFKSSPDDASYASLIASLSLSRREVLLDHVLRS